MKKRRFWAADMVTGTGRKAAAGNARATTTFMIDSTRATVYSTAKASEPSCQGEARAPRGEEGDPANQSAIPASRPAPLSQIPRNEAFRPETTRASTPTKPSALAIASAFHAVQSCPRLIRTA